MKLRQAVTGLAVAAALGSGSCAWGGTFVSNPLVLDFDTDALGNPILHGQVIDDEYAAWGVTIDVDHPSNSDLDFGLALNTAVSIEADMRTSQANGAFHPSNTEFLGNVLIAPRNNIDANNDEILDLPDTAFEKPNAEFTFSFADAVYFGGAVTILDAEEAGGYIRTYFEDSVVGEVLIPALGDNSVVTLDLPQARYDKIVVLLAGSGGLNDVTAGVDDVPEPTTAALLGLGGLAMLRRRR